MIEDSEKSRDRSVFYIDVGNMSKEKAVAYIASVRADFLHKEVPSPDNSTWPAVLEIMGAALSALSAIPQL